MDERLLQLARLCDIGLVYHDALGTERRAEAPALVAILAAMGIDAATPPQVEAAIEAAQRTRTRATLPPVRVVFEDEASISIPVNLAPPLDALRWQIDTEQGERRERQVAAADLAPREATQAPGTALVLRLDAAQLGWGYHHLTLWRDGEALGTTHLIVAPRRCYLPAAVRDGGRVWGLTAQLYALRSARNWGIGDFTDLRALVETAAACGAAVVGVNPLHALFPHNPLHASPYSPSSRLFLNTLYLDVERIIDAQGDAAMRAHVASDAFQQRLHVLRDAASVDYAAVAHAKREVLEATYAHFRSAHLAAGTPEGRAFHQWCRDGGAALHRQCLFEALQEHFFRGDPNLWGWPVWPAEYRDPTAPAVTRFGAEHADRVEFYLYLQWHADEQLAAVGRRSFELGLGVGVYADLAVSVDRGGAETWANRAVYAVAASVGAPPDPFNLRGQDWGLPPWNPLRLHEQAYAPWVAALRANMKHAGALRIDHVMALMRLYWVPPGASAVDGVYVQYPFEDLLGILALESQRNHCLVIGEDLGTVPPGIRERLAAADVLSYRLLYFERDEAGNFRPPQHYPRLALAAASTHDLPTLAGWWEGHDIELRAALGHYPSTAVRDQQLAERAHDRVRLLDALAREGLLPEDTDTNAAQASALSAPLARAAHQLLARSPALVVVAQLEDVLGVVEQANLPGTTHEHPNWCRRLPVDVAALAADERLALLARMFALERPPQRGHAA